MRKAHSRDKMRDTEGMLSTSSSITVERSYEVSVDYPNAKPSHPPESVSSFHQRDKTPSSLNLYSTYRAETSIGRPSSARDSSQPPLGHEHPICPSPVVRSSQEHLDVHEALRSPFPVFQQSRRWAKAYLSKDDRRPATSACQPPRKTHHAIACDISQPTRIEENSCGAGVDDDEPEHYGLCRPAHLPGWQTFKNHRLHRSHSMSNTRVVKTSSIKSPKRMRSVMSIRSRFRTSPRPVVLSKPFLSWRKHQEQEPVYGTPSRRAKHKRSQSSQRSRVSHLSSDPFNYTSRKAGCSVSSLHDYQKVKHFSQECVAMLSGLDFGDEWRLSTIGPSLYIRNKPSVETLTGKTSALDQTPSDHIDRSASLPQNRQNPTINAAYRTTVASTWAPQERNPRSINQVTPNPATAEDNNVVPHDPTTPSTNHETPSTARSDEKMTEAMIQNLKNARSVDTLAEIEAQFASSPSRPASHESKEKTSIYTQSPSPKRIKSSGKPPERPLPALPNGDTIRKRSASYSRTSRASSCQSKTIDGTVELLDPFGANSGSSRINAPSLANPNHPVDSWSTDAKRTSSNFTRTITRLHSASSRSRPNSFKTDIFATSSGVIDVGNRRRSKIQEIKKRHIADTYKVRGGTNVSDEIDKENCVIGCVDLTPKLRALQTIERSETSNVRHGAESVTETDKAAQKLNPLLTGDISSTMSTTSQPSEGLRGVSYHSLNSNESSRPLSKSNSLPQRNSSKRSGSKSVVFPPATREWLKDANAPTQSLSRSHIMVVVDTDPHTDSFRAGALSPTPSMPVAGSKPTSATSRPTTANSRRTTSHSRPTTPTSRRSTRKSAKVALKGLTEDECSPSSRANRPVSVPRRDSSKTLRLQAISTRSPSSNEIKKVSEYTAPAANISRCRSRASYQHLASNSDSEPENVISMKKGETSILPQERNGSRTSLNKSQKHRITPLTAMLEEEVCRIDQELDDLKRHEKRMECQQQYLEQTLRVWDQMSQTGKRRVLTAILGTTDKMGDIKTKEAHSSKMLSLAPSSIYSARSSTQNMNETLTKSLNYTRASTQTLPEEKRRVSATSTSPSTATVAHTDTDTDTFSEAADGVLVKRASDGSLTDPQDYDLPPYSRLLNIVSADKKPNADLLGSTIHDFRARLQTSRSPTITPRKSSKFISWPKPHRSGTAINTTAADAKIPPIICLSSPTDRLAVAPWEAHDDPVNSRAIVDRKSDSGDVVGSGSRSRTGSGNGSGNGNGIGKANGRSHTQNSYLLDLQQEGLRTDQMDAMIAL